MHTHTDVKENNKRYYEIEHAGIITSDDPELPSLLYYSHAQAMFSTSVFSSCKYHFCQPIFCKTFNLAKLDTTDLKALNKYIGAIS